jgi:hypothetical protein
LKIYLDAYYEHIHIAQYVRRQKIDMSLKRFWFNNIVACCFNVKQTLLESVLKQRWRSEKTLKKRWDRNLTFYNSSRRPCAPGGGPRAARKLRASREFEETI